MAITGDVVMTVFAVQGIAPLVAAYARLGNAQQNAARAEELYNKASDQAKNKGDLLHRHLLAQRTLLQSQAAMLTANAAAFGAVVFAADRAIMSLVSYGRELQNIQDLTGATAKESSRALGLFKVAGLSDITEIREIMKLNEAIFTSQGRSALTRLGVAPNPNQSGFQLFMDVADALEGMQDGLRKTQIMQDIFGTRGIAAILPLLRMTREQRDAVLELSDSFNTEGLAALQAYGFSVSFLWQTIMVKLVFPIARVLLPLFEKIVQMATLIIDKAGGFFAWAIATAAIAFSITRIVAGLRLAVELGKTLVMLARAEATWKTVVAFLTNPVAAGIALAAGIGAAALLNANLSGGGGDKRAAGEDKFARAVNKFESAVERMESNFEDLKGHGIPGGMSAVDVGSLQRQFALGVIG